MTASTLSNTPANDASLLPTSRFQPWQSIKHRKFLVFLTFIMVLLLGIFAAFFLEKAQYTTKAVIFISPKSETTLENRSEELRGQDYNRYVKQQQSLLRHPSVLKETLQIEEVRNIWFVKKESTGKLETDGDAVGRLFQALTVTASPNSSPLIEVSITSNKKEGLEIVLNTLINIYLRKSQEDAFYDSSGRVNELQRVLREYQGNIESWQKRRLEIAQSLGVTTFQENNLNPYDTLLIATNSSYKNSRRDRAQAEARLSALQGAQGKINLESLINELLQQNSSFTGLKNNLLTKRNDLLQQQLGLTPEHPSYQSLQQNIKFAEQELQQLQNKFYQEAKEQILSQRRAAVYESQQIENALLAEINNQKREAINYASLYSEALSLEKEIDRTYKQIDRINDRIDSLNLESSAAPGFARLSVAAAPPLEPIQLGKRKIIALFAILGLLVGFSVPIMLDFLDFRVYTTAEVSKILGFPPMAWVVERSKAEYEPLIFDQLRRLAMSLERERQQQHNRYFALTSVKSDGGTTSLTLDLARKLSELGIRTLAIELNAFNPDPRYQHPLHHREGLAQILNYHDWQPSELDALIVPETPEMPARLPIGECAQRHLLTHGRLSAILNYLNSRFDMLLFDTPPILLSADTELLGKLETGILLVIESGQLYPADLKRAAKLLERLNPPVVAAVLNRVKVNENNAYIKTLLQEYMTAEKPKRHWFFRWLWR